MSRVGTPSTWPTSASELTFERQLGRGFFGEVWQCRLVAQADVSAGGASPTLAVKKVPLSIIRQHNLSAQMDREIAILRGLRHPHIVQLFFDFRDDSYVYLGMEFAEGGGMFDRLASMGSFNLEVAAQYFYETCDALEYLHGLPETVIHRDIKPENILLDKDGHVKLADFGWSNAMDNANSRGTFCGTPDYLAPEMILGQGHNESLDMWEMGVLLYELVVGKSPFGSSCQEKTCRLILKCDLRFPDGVDADARDLIQKLCKLKPEERLTAAQAKQHLFVVRNYRGRPTEVVGPAQAADAQAEDERPSVAVRRLRCDKAVLEGEMAHILKAKSLTEQELFNMTNSLEEAYEKIRVEQKAREAADKELARLKELETRQLREAEELRRSTEALAAKVLQLKHGAGA